MHKENLKAQEGHTHTPRSPFEERRLYVGEFVDQGRGSVRTVLLKAERPADLEPAEFNQDLMVEILALSTRPDAKPTLTAQRYKTNGRSFDRTELITDEELSEILKVKLTMPGYLGSTATQFIEGIDELPLDQTEKDRLIRLAKEAWNIAE